MLSNAFKFTNEGGKIDLTFAGDDEEVTISVKDTGIGIAPEKQQMVFEAFQQADGSTSRKYGGTGLGLAISRELATLLNGNIKVESVAGEGSTFTLFISVKKAFDEAVMKPQEPVQEDVQIKIPLPAPVKDGSEKPLLLIVEDDEQFAAILSNYAREQGYRTAVLYNGIDVTEKVKELNPSAIVLDIMLPGKDGWQILRELKKDDRLAAIPVHLMSAGDATAGKAHKAGALSFLKKPVTKERLDELFGMLQPGAGSADNQVLLIEDHEIQSSALRTLFQEKGISVQQAYTGKQAMELLRQKEFSCVILDLNLPDISGTDLLDQIKSDEKFHALPVIINTAMELDKITREKLTRYANATILKNSKSSDRLIDEVNLFLHKLKSAGRNHQPENGYKKAISASAPTTGREVLKNKRVLLVDDDMRNIFAVSTALQEFEMHIEIANDGVEALDKLQMQNGFDAVLMDMMMPRMDGYECMQKIREIPAFKNLPVIALTAKAMKGDREKCIEAGASDYVTKPVDVDILVNLLQVWTS